MSNVIIYNKMDNKIKFNYLLGDTAILYLITPTVALAWSDEG